MEEVAGLYQKLRHQGVQGRSQNNKATLYQGEQNVKEDLLNCWEVRIKRREDAVAVKEAQNTKDWDQIMREREILLQTTRLLIGLCPSTYLETDHHPKLICQVWMHS